MKNFLSQPREIVRLFAAGLALFPAFAPLLAQVTPATPTKFGKRDLGQSADPGSILVAPKTGPAAPPVEKTFKSVIHFSLSPTRQWTSQDGKVTVGQLIAFEDVIVESKNGAPPPRPAQPEKPTIVKDGKVRLLIDGKVFEFAPEKLSAPDREFIGKIMEATPKKPAPGN